MVKQQRILLELEAEIDMNRIQLTKDQAQAIMDAHELSATLQNDEERELLEANNPELYEAYQALEKIADGQ